MRGGQSREMDSSSQNNPMSPADLDCSDPRGGQSREMDSSSQNNPMSPADLDCSDPRGGQSREIDPRKWATGCQKHSPNPPEP